MSSRLVSLFMSLAAALTIASTSEASVRKEGAWPADEAKVSFTFEGKPSEGLSKLAKEAKWSLVVSNAVAMDEHAVRVDVTDQPADAVLDALFSNAHVQATRTGALITITPDTSPAPAPAPAPAPSTAPTTRGEDRTTFGGSTTVERGEVVRDLTITGGSAVVRGTVTGDITVTGGSAVLERDAHVHGDATIFGGSIKMEEGARIDGNVGIIGGALKKDDGAIVGGKVVHNSSKKNKAKADHGDDKDDEPATIAHRVRDFGQSTTKMSLLFVLGCVLLSLLTSKMEALRVEVASRPMRSFAAGLIGSILAAFAFLAVCITIVGIPFAILATILGVLAVYGSISAVLTTFGAAVFGHRTSNPYAHLLVGCVAFLVASSIPYLGGIVTFVVTMIAIGALITNMRGGRFFQRPRHV